MVKKTEKVEYSDSISSNDSDSIRKLKKRIENKDGGYTIINQDGTYRRYDKNGKFLIEGIYKGTRDSKNINTKVYAKGGGVRKPKMTAGY